MEIKKGSRILFEGDSITDAGRDRDDFHSLAGYTKYIAETPGAENCFNRGISGNRTGDLLARIEASLDEVKPDCVSILIGINDVWRRYDANEPTAHGQFERNYDEILRIVSARTDKIILLEPYLIPTDPAKEIMREDLNPKIDLVRKLALKYRTAYVPLNGLFAEASILGDPAYYSGDSVHPADGGHRFIAAEWLKRVALVG